MATKAVWLGVWLVHAAYGQFFDNTVDRPVSAKNDTGGFKPPFPVNCRPIDFDQWKSFEGSEESIGSEGTIRCASLYQDPTNQPVGYSSFSNDNCLDSMKSYAQVVRMNNYLDTKLVGSALTTDHDIWAQFHHWYDQVNMRLLEQFNAGFLAGDEVPKVTDMCANAYGNFMCSNILPNCTYMPYARWPYHELFEKIYTCKEVCLEVKKWCDASWIPHEVRCDDLISNKIDLKLDPTMMEMSAYDRYMAGGHACSTIHMSVYFQGGVAGLVPQTRTMGLVLAVALLYLAGVPGGHL